MQRHRYLDLTDCCSAHPIARDSEATGQVWSQDFNSCSYSAQTTGCVMDTKRLPFRSTTRWLIPSIQRCLGPSPLVQLLTLNTPIRNPRWQTRHGMALTSHVKYY